MNATGGAERGADEPVGWEEVIDGGSSEDQSFPYCTASSGIRSPKAR